MKKIFTITFIAALFCSSIFAEDYIVTKTIGTVKHKTSDGVWEVLKPGDTITGETVVEMKINSQAIITKENGETYKIKFPSKGSVSNIIADKNDSKQTTIRNKIVEEATMPAHIDEMYSETFSKFGFKPIKDLPKNKNAIRLCSVSYSYDIIELTWTKSEASIVFYDGDMDKKSERKINLNEVQKVVSQIEGTDFYNQPAYVYNTGYSTRDGLDYYVEANIEGKYKSVEREWPSPDFMEKISHELYTLAKEK